MSMGMSQHVCIYCVPLVTQHLHSPLLQGTHAHRHVDPLTRCMLPRCLKAAKGLNAVSPYTCSCSRCCVPFLLTLGSSISAKAL